MNKLSILLILIFGCGNLGISQINIDSLFKIIKNDVLDECNYEFGKIDINGKINYYTFLKHATIEDLIPYLKDEVPTVRAKIFQSIIMKNPSDSLAKSLLTQHINDTAEIVIKTNSCVKISYNVFSFMNFNYNFKDTTKIDFDRKIQDLLESNLNNIKLEIPGLKNNLIHLDSLHAITEIKTNFKDFKLLSVSIIIGTENFNSNGNEFSNEMRLKLKELKSKDFIILHNIRILDSSDILRHISSIIIGIR